MMYKNVILLYIMLGTIFPLHGQLFNAGPDTTICSGTGVMLGDPNQNIPSTWCITWSPAESLDNPHAAQPHATPKNTTTYTATVLTDDWQSVVTDQVKVTVGFGGIKFTPPYLYQGGEDSVQAEVTINPGMDTVLWTISEPTLGCGYNEKTGKIRAGSQFGTITVKAFKKSSPECYAEEKIDINEGVKDITARDLTHPGRIAKGETDTLYLVGESAYAITAIPNASGFAGGAPFWYDDGTPYAFLPSDGQVTMTGSTTDQHHITAGSAAAGYQPKVVIKHFDAEEYVLDIGPLVSSATEALNKVNEFICNKIRKKYPAVPQLNLNVDFADFSYKRSIVEKYNHPGFDYKRSIEASASMGMSGRIYHPGFTQTFDFSLIGFAVGTELYLEPFFDLTLSGGAAKDPSSDNPNWTILGNPIKATLTGGLRGVFTIWGEAAGYYVEGGFNLATSLFADFTFNLSNGEFNSQFGLNPLQGQTKVEITRLVDPKKKWTFFNHTVDLIDKWQSPSYLLFDFGAQN